MKARDIIKLVEADGWVYIGSKGSHCHYKHKHPSKAGKVTVPGKPSSELPRGMEKSILMQAGLGKES